MYISSIHQLFYGLLIIGIGPEEKLLTHPLVSQFHTIATHSDQVSEFVEIKLKRGQNIEYSKNGIYRNNKDI